MRKPYFLLGGALMASLLWLVLGAAAPAPVQRNQWTTNVQGQPIIGDFAVSNGVAGSGTNFVVTTFQGFTSFAPGPRQLWKLYGWGTGGPAGDSALDWAGSSSRLATNGSIVINGHNIDLNADGAASFAAVITNTFLTASRAIVSDANKRLTSATGTPDGTKFLRDDNTYAVPAGTGLTSSLLGSNVMVLTDGNTNLISAGVSNLTWASTVDINFNVGPYQYLIMTNDTTFTGSRLGAAKAVAIKIFAGATNYNLTFPAWTFIGNTAPATISSNKTAVLSLTCFDGNTTNVVAAYAVQP